MERSNTTRRQDNGSDSELLEHFLKLGLKPMELAGILKSRGMSQEKIDEFIKRYEHDRAIAKKAVKLFLAKVERNPEYNDVHKLMTDAKRYATKHKLTPSQSAVFMQYLTRGGPQDAPYSPYSELKYTEMSKFFGFASRSHAALELRPQDYSLLEKISNMYSSSKNIYNAIKSSLVTYQDCSPQAYSGEYNREKHNIHSYIHPVVVAMFFPKIQSLERRMLCSNIGRLLINKSQLYFDPAETGRLKNLPMAIITETTRDEYMADEALMVDIARDPNSLSYLSDETPMTNMIKRYAVQIELWKNVLALRQGKFYSSSDSFTADDGITGLARTLADFDTTKFDNIDLHEVYDEGAFLRKLLGVFSIRPTMISLTTSTDNVYTNYGAFPNVNNIGALTETTFITVPVINVRIPQAVQHPGDLRDHLNQEELFLIGPKVTTRARTVVQSMDIMFINIYRRKQSNTWAATDTTLTYLYNPMAVIPSIEVDNRVLEIPPTLPVPDGSENIFDLKSFVAVEQDNPNVSIRNIAYIKSSPGQGVGNDSWFLYDPLIPSRYIPENGNLYVNTSPLLIDNNAPNVLRTHATILIYIATEANRRMGQGVPIVAF